MLQKRLKTFDFVVEMSAETAFIVNKQNAEILSYEKLTGIC